MATGLQRSGSLSLKSKKVKLHKSTTNLDRFAPRRATVNTSSRGESKSYNSIQSPNPFGLPLKLDSPSLSLESLQLDDKHESLNIILNQWSDKEEKDDAFEEIYKSYTEVPSQTSFVIAPRKSSLFSVR